MAYPVLHEPGLFGKHYAPGQPIPLLSPAHIAGVGVMAQRQGDLQQGKEGQRSGAGYADTRPGTPDTPCGGRRHQRGGGVILAPAYLRPETAGPLRGKEQQRAGNHQPRENPQLRKQQPGKQMERYQRGISENPGAPPQQGRNYGQVK